MSNSLPSPQTNGVAEALRKPPIGAPYIGRSARALLADYSSPLLGLRRTTRLEASYLALVGVGAQLLGHVRVEVALPEGGAVEIVAEDVHELALRVAQVVQLLRLDPHRVHAVLAVQELDHVAH
eukprot:1642331-Pyramimonas_sp.AAC.3